MLDFISRYLFWEFKYEGNMEFYFIGEINNPDIGKVLNVKESIRSKNDICDALWNTVIKIAEAYEI